MKVSHILSRQYIEALAQKVPFRFVDKVTFLGDISIVTELHAGEMPYRFADPLHLDTYVILEFAAQSSGIILRGKKRGGRGSIVSFQNVERKIDSFVFFPIRLESMLVNEQPPFYQFDFNVFSIEELVVRGGVSIFVEP